MEGNLIIHSYWGSVAAGSPLHWQDWDCLYMCNRQLLAWTLLPVKPEGELLPSSGSDFWGFE